MLIIIEGTDCTGKTTLANKLSNELGFPILKGSSFESARCTQDELFEKFMAFTKLENTILDRFIYSNEVYAPMYEDYACLSDEQRRFIEREIKGETLMIYLYAHIDVLQERLQVRGDDYVTADKFKILKSSYLNAISKSKHIEIWAYNTGETDTDEIVRNVTTILQKGY